MKINFKHNEALLSFELYRLLVNEGFCIYPEYKAVTLEGKVCYFDLALYKDDTIYLIIEVKKSKKRGLHDFIKTKQAEKYKSFNIPILFVSRKYSLDTYVRSIIKRFSFLL